MKKLPLFAIVLSMLTVVFFSCKKDNNNINDYSGNQTLQNNKNVIELIQNFENKLTNTYKAGETMELDSAVWNMEALLNYSYAEIDTSSREITFVKAQYTLTVDQNGNVLLDNVETLYDEMADYLSTYENNQSTSIVFADVNADSVVSTTAYLSLSVGVVTNNLILGIYEQFTEDDNWIWGTLSEEYGASPLGKCDGTQYGVSDGSNEIQRRLNNPVLQSGEIIYFYFDLEIKEADGFYWENGEPLLYVGIDDELACLTYDMLENYLTNAHNIFYTHVTNGGLRPDNKNFVSAYIYNRLYGSNPSVYYHSYEVTFGTPSYVAPAD